MPRLVKLNLALNWALCNSRMVISLAISVSGFSCGFGVGGEFRHRCADADPQRIVSPDWVCLDSPQTKTYHLCLDSDLHTTYS